MSHKANLRQAVPEETVRVAHAAFPKRNPYLTLSLLHLAYVH